MQAVQRAVEVVEGGSVRPVQPQEAAQGRIDYVKARCALEPPKAQCP